jgi:hypothetical protein
MVPHTLIALVLAGRALLSGDIDLGHDRFAQPGPQGEAARYQAETREVTNWRSEAFDALEPKPIVALAALFKADRPLVTRCVKLNNYWCIKSARWNGELATDQEGHVGFASADHGADAAATLLRRYYMEFNRKSALDIVRRWAPAECNIATSIGGMAVLAVKGIGGTVRARYLASRRSGGSVRYTAKAGPGGKPGRVSMVIPIRPMPIRPMKTPQYRVPDIAAGMGEKAVGEKKVVGETKARTAVALAVTRPAASSKPVRDVDPVRDVNPVRDVKPARDGKATASTAPKPDTVTACAPDEQRLRNYAGRMVEGLGLGPTDDLRLFEPDGSPLANLTQVMLAMSKFELGLLRASPGLIEAAIRRMAERVADARSGPAKTPTP